MTLSSTSQSLSYDPSMADPHSTRSSGGSQNLDSVHILLVDDRPENLVALEAVLEEPGYELVAVDSGEEALKVLLKQDFAVILMDVQMPGMDGFETAER